MQIEMDEDSCRNVMRTTILAEGINAVETMLPTFGDQVEVFPFRRGKEGQECRNRSEQIRKQCRKVFL